LPQGSDGNFYGMTNSGGANGSGGTIFQITPSGTETVVYSFDVAQYGATGRYPYGDLIFGPDGTMYGFTNGGGASPNGVGVVFKFD
jgi:uncharacterized repeat protein (TIGR03803 family)